MKLTEVTLKDGRKIHVLPGEVVGLERLGKLRKLAKEEKNVPENKAEKKKPATKKRDVISKESNLK